MVLELGPARAPVMDLNVKMVAQAQHHFNGGLSVENRIGHQLGHQEGGRVAELVYSPCRQVTSNKSSRPPRALQVWRQRDPSLVGPYGRHRRWTRLVGGKTAPTEKVVRRPPQ